jgi:hypothetical protein
MKQVWPSSITGTGLGPAGSLLEHRFGQGEPYTLGVEEEYMLLDAESFDLVQRIDTVLAAIVGHEDEARIKPGAFARPSAALPLRTACASARPGPIHSACSSDSGSPPATAIAPWSTRCSTSRAGS